MQTIWKMGLRPDICGQEEALQRFRLMQVSIAPDYGNFLSNIDT